MDPRQSPALFKYFDPADRFVRIRLCTPEEAGIRMRPDLDRAAYRREVVAACVEGFEEPDAALAELQADPPEDALELLYQLVVSVNPGLEIRAVGLSADAEDEPRTELRLAPEVDAGDTSHALRRRARGLEKRLLERVFGQDDAVCRVAGAVRRAAAGLARGRGPLASLLFVGPTGTGKTELARALADELSEAGVSFLRIDCGELSQGHETSKLLGAPPGYVGFEDGGMLTETMKRNPRAIVLFDEIEKAHPRLHNVLLSLLEEGELTDGRGQRVAFDRSIVLMTSNAGARESQAAKPSLGFSPQPMQDEARQEIADDSLAGLFSPEFLGRLDEVVHFRSLGSSDARRIARAHLTDLAQRVRETGLRMRWTEAVASWAARTGFSQRSGAREIARVLRREVEGPLSDALLEEPAPIRGEGERARGPRWIQVTIRDGRPRVAPDARG